MSEEIKQSSPGDTPSSRMSGILGILGGLIISVTAGSALGMFVLGPRLAPASAPYRSQASAAPDTYSSGGTVSNPQSLYVLENIVLNPAESNGTRFLLLSVAVALRDDASAAILKTRDPEIRDRILNLFGNKTTARLAEASARNALRQDVKDTLQAMFPTEHIQAVYFPQFVIQ